MSRILLIIVGTAMLLGGCNWMKKKETPATESREQLLAAQHERIRRACASTGTYERLKELVFDEATRIRKGDPRNLDPLAAETVVRMEDPVVKSRDETLNITVCTGRFVIELPPGAESAFDGERRLTANVEYAAQAALDGSGLVYEMDGAEPIIYRLAAVGLRGQPMPKIAAVHQAPPAAPAAATPVPAASEMPQATPARPQATSPPKPKVETASPQPLRVTARPSFNCRYARTSTERMVCGSPVLAAKDREMASLFYALLADADPGTRAHLRRSRDAFLASRERCGSEDCVAAAYTARVAELRSIAAGQ
ncbi:MAG: lysozyme inhibitor LprI family protein [Allosphingosinicella sp.]